MTRLDQIRDEYGDIQKNGWNPSLRFMEDVRLLLDAVEAAQAYAETSGNRHHTDTCPCGEPFRRLRAALAPLLEDE